MSDYKIVIDEKSKEVIELTKKLANLELNFRTYISEKGLSEESYKIASQEYSDEIKTVREKMNEVEKALNEIQENTNYISNEQVNELNVELGRIWRIIIANSTFCDEYGGVQFGSEPTTNLYKEIYDKHLEELKNFMNYFVKIVNLLCSK